MNDAIEEGYSVLVIDSLSHQWNGDGGILSRKEEADKKPGSNSYTNWAAFTKEHTAFVGKVLQLPIHVIATLRSKQDYILETNERGKQQPLKVGMAPVQREGLEYEFSTVFDVQMDHRALASKDRTGLFGDEGVDLVKPATGKRLLAWLATGAAVPETAPEQHTSKRDVDKVWRGKPLGDYTTVEIGAIHRKYQSDPNMATLIESLENILLEREEESRLVSTPADGAVIQSTEQIQPGLL